MDATEVEKLKGHMTEALKNLGFKAGTKLGWKDKVIPVYQDDDGYFWLDAKCFTMAGAVEYAAKQLGIVTSEIVYVVVKEYDHGSVPVAAYKDRNDAEKKRMEVQSQRDVINAHVTPLEVQ